MSVTQPTYDWEFRQGSSTTITDSKGGLTATYKNGLSSTFTNGAYFAGGGVSSGNLNYIELPSFQLGGNFSLEFYAQFDDSASFTKIFDFGNAIDSNDTAIRFGRYSTGTTLYLDTNNGTGTASRLGAGGTITNSTFIHYVITFNGTTAILYMNGTSTITDTAMNIPTTTTRTYHYLGKSLYGTDQYFKGYMGYFRVYQGTALSSSEITTLYNNRATVDYFNPTLTLPTHNYEFRVAETTSVSDLMGSGGIATYEGSATSNTNDGVIINNPNRNEGNFVNFTPFTITDTTYSMEFYFTIVTDLGYHFIMDIQETASSSSNLWGLATSNPSTSFQARHFNSAFNLSSTTDPTAGTAYHVVISRQKNGASYFYINNAINGTNASKSITEYTSPLTVHAWELGRRAKNNDFYGDFKMYYTRYWDNHALTYSEVNILYNNRSTNFFTFSFMRINYGDVYLAQNLIKTLADYKAENIPIQDISFGVFPANKYKQSYIKDLLDVSGSFIQRQHTFYSDMSFNVSDLSADQVIVNNDLSVNSGFNIFHDSSFNSNVGIVGDLSINGTLTIEDNSIPESALNFVKPASNFGTFDSTQDVSMSDTFTLQGDHERFIDLSQNIQTDFSENIVLVPGSLEIDLSGGIATLSGKTGDQAFLNGTYIVKDNSGNTTGNIYDDFNENTTPSPTQLSATPDYYWDFRVATPSGNTLADRVSGINATYYGGITSSETTGVSFTERSGWSSYTGETQSQYVAPGDIIPGTDFTIEYYIEPSYTFDGFGQIHKQASTSDGSIVALACVYYSGGMNINVYFYPASGASYNVMTHSGTGNVYSVPYNTPAHVVVSYDNLNTVFKIYINGSLWSITYDDSSRATGATAENTSYGYASGTALPNAKGHIICDDNKIGAISLTSPRPFEGNYYYLRHYKDKILTDADVATLYANASTINWDFQTVVNNNKLTSLPKNWNAFQFQNGGGWLYDGSSNYTSYLDQYGRPQTVKGDSYDLTLPFHFYPSKAYLRTTPVLPTGLTNLDNYPASVKFLGASTSVVPLPTYSWDFRVDTSTSINDSIQNVTATYVGTTSTVENGLAYTGTTGHATLPAGINNGPGENSVEFYIKHTAALDSWDTLFSVYTNSNCLLYLAKYGTEADFTVINGDAGNTGTAQPLATNISATAYLNQWLHIVVAYEHTSGDDTCTGRFYANGSLVSTHTGLRKVNDTSTSASTSTGYIGSPLPASGATYNNTGYIRYFRLYNKNLSEEEVKILYSNLSEVDHFSAASKYHLLGEFENKSTKVQADTSANYTYNSTVFLSDLPTPRYAWDFRVATSASVNDKVNNIPATYYQTSSTVEDGLAFTGSAAHATIPAGIFIGNSTNEISFEVYYKPTGLGMWTRIFQVETTSANSSVYLSTYGTAGYMNFGYGNKTPSGTNDFNQQITNLSSSSTNEFIHLIGTIESPSDVATNGTIGRYYKNGTLIQTITGGRYTDNDSASASTNVKYIGSQIGPSYSATDGSGYIRYLRFFNKRLSEQEITSLYNTRDNRDAFKNVSTTLTPFNGYIPTPTYNWDIRNNQSFTDNIGNNVGTGYHGATIGSNGLVCPGGTAGDHVKVTNYAWGGTNSIELLCYVNSITDTQNGYYGHTTSGSGYFWISCLNGLWAFYTHTDSSPAGRHYYSHTNGKAAAIIGGWNHIVIVFEPSSSDKTLTFYVNGVEITEAAHYSGQTTTYITNSGGTNTSEGTYTLNSSSRGGYYMIGSHNYNADVGSSGAVPDGIVAHVRYWSGTGLTASDVHNLNKYKHYITFSSSGYAISTLPSFNTAGYSVSSVPAVSSDIYIHGADFLYNLNRKYYVNQLRMIVDKATDSSGNSYGEYSIDRLAYTGSSFSGKKMESNNPNLYLNTTYDISYGFTEDHTNNVYDLSYNKNQFSILDVSGGGVIQVNPTIKLEDSSLNTEKITSGAKIGVHYDNKLQTPVSSFNNDFYNYLGIRDASGFYNNRISNDGKTIATLNHRGTESYDASYAEVVFSTDYGKNWKDVLKDCSDTFLFNENDVSYNNLFATGDASGAIDIATSGNGQTVYVGRQSNVFTIQNNYIALGKTDPPLIDIDTTRSTGFPQSMFSGSGYVWGSSSSGSTTSQTATLTSSNNQLGLTEAEGTYTVSCGGGWTFYTAYGGYPPGRQFHNVSQYTTSIYGDMRASNGGGWNPSGSITAVDANGNSNTYTVCWIKFDFPSTITVKPTTFTIHMDYNASHQKYIFGEDVNGVTRLLASNSQTIGNGGRTISLSNIGDGLKSLTYSLGSSGNYYRILNAYFRGSVAYGSGHPGIPIPTSGVPEIYTTNYGNSWKISPFKFHSGPTIISGDGSTILLLQQHKLNNDRHGYVSSLGNETSSIDCHWLTTDYGATWRTLNRTGHDASNNIIPPSYGSKTATFFKACMSYSGQYIYIYNVQCTNNSNYGELYYSHDYGVTFNKWVTSEAQTVITGTGQISCSGSGKYVYIAGTNSSSAFVYYRSTDYGLTFNKDITKFPWQSYTLSESSTSAGPFISYNGDLIVTAGSNTSVTTGNSDLQYSLDYGLNYNNLSLNSDPVSTITNNFTNLPNKTNTLFTTTDASTKTGIFANSPGPNEYKFLSNILGQTDVSNIYLQTIEFPKENPTKTIENEGPVFFTSEEPIDKENDFGQNISNSLIGSNKLWNIAVSEDGQKLLASGAIDVSNGVYYNGYNLTNAKFPPTENVYDTTGNGIPQPLRDYNFLITGAASSTMSDNISGSEATYGSNVTSTTTNGIAISGNGGSVDQVTVVAPEFSNSFCFETVIRFNANGNYAGLFAFKNGSSNQNIICDLYSTNRRFRFYSYASNSIVFASHSGGTHTGTTITTDGSTYHHMVFQYSAENEQAEYYQDGVRVWYQSNRTYPSGNWPRTYSTNAIGDINNNTNFNMKYFRIWNNRALSSSEITTLYNNQTTVYLANSWILPLPHFKTANLSYDGNQALLVPYGITQTNAQNLYYWTASGDFHRFGTTHLSQFDPENWKFGKLSGDGNFFVGFTHSSTALSETNYNSDTWWTDPVSNNMIIYKTMQKISKGTVADTTATTEAGGTTYDLNNAFASDSGVTSYYITHVNVSETGQYILIVGGNSTSTYTNRCAFSSDFGVTFSDISSKFSFTDVTKALVYCHVSDNGRYLFISQYNSNEYCFSADYGNTFTLRNTFPSSTKTYGVVSRDGQNALFADTNEYVYTSVNGNFRQEAIPALSGVNSGLSLTHNNWKYSSTLPAKLLYNPSMPNIKCFLGTIQNIFETTSSLTAPTHYYEFRLENSTSVSDQMGSGGTATYQGGSVSTSSNGVVLDTDYSNLNTGPKYVDITPPSVVDGTYSYELYFKVLQVGAWSHLANINHGSGELWTAGDGTNIQISAHNTQSISSSVSHAVDVYHIVLTVTKNGSAIAYVTKGTNATVTNSITPTTQAGALSMSSWNLGRRAGSYQNAYSNVEVYYTRWWNNHALSASEVAYLYANREDTTFMSSDCRLVSSNVRYTQSYFSELDIKGSLTNLSGTGYTSSDYRVKKNVKSLNEAITISNLKPVSYTQNNLHHKKAVGFIAHEFAQSFPDLVTGEKDGPEMQSINYNGVIAILIKEIQTLRAKINELKSQI